MHDSRDSSGKLTVFTGWSRLGTHSMTNRSKGIQKRDKAEAKSKNRQSPKKRQKDTREQKGWNVDTQKANAAYPPNAMNAIKSRDK